MKRTKINSIQNASKNFFFGVKLFVGLFFFVFIFSSTTKGQSVGINATGAAPSSSAMLDVSSSNSGLLLPRVALQSTTDVTTIASPATSLIVYNTNSSMTGGSVGFFYWDGTQWQLFYSRVPRFIKFSNIFDADAKSLVKHLVEHDLTKRYGNLKNGNYI